MISKVLIIQSPWIELILDGKKTWEMRSQATSTRGWLGLVKKGTGHIYGVAQLTEVLDELSHDEMLASVDKHQIPADMLDDPDYCKYRRPWVLNNVVKFAQPVAYHHKNGAVTFAIVDGKTSEEVLQQYNFALQDDDEKAVLSSVDQAPAVQSAEPDPQPEIKPTAAPVATISTDATAPASDIEIGTVELTAGNIRNNHFYLRPFFDKFPQKYVGGSNKNEPANSSLLLDWGDAELVETELDGDKKIFRKRGWVKKFFQINKAAPGDIVRISQAPSGVYVVQLTPRG